MTIYPTGWSIRCNAMGFGWVLFNFESDRSISTCGGLFGFLAKTDRYGAIVEDETI